jgi:hypothetical protein
MWDARWFIVMFVLTASPAALARVLLEATGNAGPVPESQERVFAIDPGWDDAPIALAATVNLSQGTLSVRLVRADGSELYSASAQEMTAAPGQIEHAGRFDLHVTTYGVVGRWQVTVAPQIVRPELHLHVVGSLMTIATALGSLTYARKRLKVHWRWFAVGAGLWIVAIIFKFIWAITVHRVSSQWLELHLPRPIYLVVGSLSRLAYGHFRGGRCRPAGVVVAEVVDDRGPCDRNRRRRRGAGSAIDWPEPVRKPLGRAVERPQFWRCLGNVLDPQFFRAVDVAGAKR